MAEYTPDQNFKHPVCRGSWAFGNNCKVCERCQATHPGRAGTQLLTNPNHTDTSRSGDLVANMRDTIREWERDEPRDDWFLHQHDFAEAADRIEALEAENERLNAILSAMNDTDVIARTMAENERLNEALCFIGKWVERGMFCNSVTASEAISCIAHYPDMPWNSQRWDVDHKPYAAAYYAKFPRTAALAGDSHDQ